MYYSQSGEDKIMYEKFLNKIQNGVFLEMGACDGVLYSNTLFLEKTCGWTGILIEPHPNQFEKLKKTDLTVNYIIIL